MKGWIRRFGNYLQKTLSWQTRNYLRLEVRMPETESLKITYAMQSGYQEDSLSLGQECFEVKN